MIKVNTSQNLKILLHRKVKNNTGEIETCVESFHILIKNKTKPNLRVIKHILCNMGNFDFNHVDIFLYSGLFP